MVHIFWDHWALEIFCQSFLISPQPCLFSHWEPILQRKILKWVENDIKQKDMDPMLDTNITRIYSFSFNQAFTCTKRKSYFIPACLKPHEAFSSSTSRKLAKFSTNTFCSSDHFRNQLPYTNRIFSPWSVTSWTYLYGRAGQERLGYFWRPQKPDTKNYYKVILYSIL